MRVKKPSDGLFCAKDWRIPKGGRHRVIHYCIRRGGKTESCRKKHSLESRGLKIGQVTQRKLLIIQKKKREKKYRKSSPRKEVLGEGCTEKIRLLMGRGTLEKKGRREHFSYPEGRETLTGKEVDVVALGKNRNRKRLRREERELLSFGEKERCLGGRYLLKKKRGKKQVIPRKENRFLNIEVEL